MAAVSCEFFRGSCAHAEIFGSEYKRTNRTKRTKARDATPSRDILRCFPHCCPQHVNRSYCGSPVLVRVRLPVERSARAFGRSWTRSHSDVLVFAHFEEAQAHQLRVGSELPADAVFGAVQTELTPKGVWIEGALQRSDLEQNEHVYQVNAGARWYYEWESAATKAQRFTKHVLRVYVFERAPPAADALGPRLLRVVALATSPEFLVVSYRRAPAAEGRAEAKTEAATEARTGAKAEGAASPKDAPQRASPERDPLDGGVAAPAPRRSRRIRRPSPRDAARVAALDVLRADHRAWAALHADAMLAVKHLAVLYHFMMSVDALQFHACLRQWSVLLYHQLEGAQPPQKLEAFLKPGGGGGPEPDADPTARVVRACAGVLGWLVFDRETVDRMARLVAESAAGLLDARALRSGYLQAVALLRDRADRLAAPPSAPPPPVTAAAAADASTPAPSALSLLTEQILTVVFQNDAFSSLRPVLIGVLTAPTMFGFQAFVAQARAVFVAAARPRPAPPVGRAPASPFDGTWDLDGNRSSVKAAAAGFSLGCAMHFLREWAQVSLRVTSEQSVAVASSWSVQPDAAAGLDRALPTAMNLTLDGRRRVFRHFPSGLSSMIPMGAQLLGDYRGQIEAPTRFWVEFASADETGAGGGLRWALQFQTEDDQAGEASTLSVLGSIEPPEGSKDPQQPSERFLLSLVFARADA